MIHTYRYNKGPPQAQNQANIFLRLLGSFYTFVVFMFTCFLAPSFFFLYIGMKACRAGWFWWLEKRFPELDFIRETTPRTAVDTVRNQGIITLLLGAGATTDIPTLKKTVKEEVLGGHLRTVLTSRWGRYAWVRNSEPRFNLDNHVTLAPTTFKGRPLSQNNLQEYVSDVVSKLLAPDIPPWQIIVINTQVGDSYLLIRCLSLLEVKRQVALCPGRLHHLYQSEDKLSLSDLLMADRGQSTPPEDSLLHSMLTPPHVIPQVGQKLSESVSNWCNECVSRWDPLENPTVTKSGPSLCLLARLTAVTAISVCRGHSQGPLPARIGREATRRGLSHKLALRSLAASLRPSALISSLCTSWWRSLGFVISAPFSVIRDTPVYLYWLCLVHYALQEVFSLASVLYGAPRILFEELFVPEHPRNVHRLQTLSLCGRKVVSWSEPVPLQLIDQLRRATGASTPELLLSATASSLSQYFQEAGMGAPEDLMTACRVVDSESGGGGVLCLPLPLAPASPKASLHALKSALSLRRPRQPALYLASYLGLLTSLFPAVISRACLYLLSRRYTVGLTLVSHDARAARRLVWGSRVRSVMYWRPPQANACLSVTVMSYGAEVRLGVMSDAQLSPHHAVITNSFPSNVYALASDLGIDPNTPHLPTTPEQ